MKKLIIPVLTALAGAFIAVLADIIWVQPHFTKTTLTDQNQAPLQFAANRALPSDAIDLTSAADLSVKAVVHVKTKVEYASGNIFDFFFGNSQPQYYSQTLPVGSGVCVSSDGYIVTNNHVINNSENVEVTLYDKRSYPAKVVATDPSVDIALLKIDADNLPYLSFGNSDDLRLGEWVLAVGNPFNLTSTVTAGIVSAKARNIGINSPFSIESFIQTDAAVNPGNSGGALVNVRGELVGINTAIASQTGSYVGYSFAVPSNIVKKVVSDFIKYGEVQRAYLGVNILPVDQELAKEKNLATTQGVYVQGVYDNGSAKDAGIQPGDVIVSINNNPVKDIPQLQEQIGQFEPGQRVSVSFLRGSKEMTADVILKNTKNSTDIIKSSYSKALGAKLQTATPDDLRRLRINGGAKVVEVLPGKLKSVGIKPGFIIAAINKQTIKTAEEAELMLSQIKGNVMIEGMYPNGMYAYFSFWNN
ncbi:MAG TPA: Do family serine endopeptidase [Bacteroidales bacterium]|nr:Do family serine endopeptidase [Bacteroidales bacterium]